MHSVKFPIKQPVIALVGPTAIGKTALSLSLASHFNCEIVSLDSMQVYRYMNIGTAKASREERDSVPHHLIDIVNPDVPYDAQKFYRDALLAVHQIHVKNKVPLLTGGTGLYLRSLTEGLFQDQVKSTELRQELKRRLEKEGASKLHEELSLIDCDAAKRVHKNDSHRLIRALEIYYDTGTTWTDHLHKHEDKKKEVRFKKILQIGLTCDRKNLYQRINKRTTMMLQSGLKEEVEDLISKGYSKNLKSMQSIGYRHMINHLYNNWTMEETERLLSRDTRRYAKRQYTWFNKIGLEWFEPTETKKIYSRIKLFLKKDVKN